MLCACVHNANTDILKTISLKRHYLFKVLTAAVWELLGTASRSSCGGFRGLIYLVIKTVFPLRSITVVRHWRLGNFDVHSASYFSTACSNFSSSWVSNFKRQNLYKNSFIYSLGLSLYYIWALFHHVQEHKSSVKFFANSILNFPCGIYFGLQTYTKGQSNGKIRQFAFPYECP